MRSTASRTMSSTSTGSSGDTWPSSMRESCEQVLDGATDAEGLVLDPGGQALGDLRVVLGLERLGEEPDGPDRRLQLVADVGHEVGAHRLEAAALGDVVDHGHGRAAQLDSSGAVVITTTRRGGPKRSIVRLAGSPRSAESTRSATAASTSASECRAATKASAAALRSTTEPVSSTMSTAWGSASSASCSRARASAETVAVGRAGRGRSVRAPPPGRRGRRRLRGPSSWSRAMASCEAGQVPAPLGPHGRPRR